MAETFTLSDLKNRTGDVLHAADREPLRLTRHGQERYVLLRVEDFDRLMAVPKDPRQVFRAGEEPPEVAELLALALNSITDEEMDAVELVRGVDEFDPDYEPDIIARKEEHA